MAAHIQAGILQRQTDGIVKRPPVRHQRRRPQNAVLEGLHNAGVHTFGQTEVVRVHNQAPMSHKGRAEREKISTRRQLY